MTNDTGWFDLIDLPLPAKKKQIFYTKVKCAQGSLDRFKFFRLSSLLQCQQTSGTFDPTSKFLNKCRIPVGQKGTGIAFCF